MNPRRHLDEVRPLSGFCRRLGLLLLCLGGLWLSQPQTVVWGADSEVAECHHLKDPQRCPKCNKRPAQRVRYRPWFLNSGHAMWSTSNLVSDSSFGDPALEKGSRRGLAPSHRSGPSRGFDSMLDPMVADTDANSFAEPVAVDGLPAPYWNELTNRQVAMEPGPAPFPSTELIRPLCPVHEMDLHQFSLCEDVRGIPGRWSSDLRGIANCENALFLGTFAGVALILRNNVDDHVAQDVQQHGPYGGGFTDTVAHFGDPFMVQIPLIAGLYATSLLQQNEDLHELSTTMFASFNFSIVGSLTLQYATGTHRSDGGAFDSIQDHGFPSAPAATSFALAAVIDERYGWRGGVPAYITAGLIGWSEIDQNQRQVSDVVFGAALGYAIGKSIASMRYHPNNQFKLVPFVDIWGRSQGIGFERRF